MNQELLTIKTQYAGTLHDIGDKLERIADELKNIGNETEYKKLYQLGNEVEHFFDQFEEAASYKSAQSADGLNAEGGKNQSTGLSEPDYSPQTDVNNHTQESQ